MRLQSRRFPSSRIWTFLKGRLPRLRRGSPNFTAGFTLVEVLIYIAIFAVVAGMLSTVLITVIRTQSRDAASNEVATQLDFVLTTVQRLVRDSSLIDIVYEGTSTSTACSTYCTMRLRMEDSTREPTIIRSDANGVYLMEGTSDEVSLTTGKITVNNFNITKFETAGGHATVQVDVSFTFNSPKPELAITKTLQSAISRVSAAVFDSDLIPNADNTWSIGQATRSWRDLVLSNDLTVGGFVGIGTTAPDNLLSLNRASGDVILDFDIADADKWVLGVDDSDADKFKIESGGFLGGATPAFVITSAGNIGIGTVSPGAKLEVAGQIKITGGTPAVGEVLTSDADGLATWESSGGGGIGESVMYLRSYSSGPIPETCPAGWTQADYKTAAENGSYLNNIRTCYRCP